VHEAVAATRGATSIGGDRLTVCLREANRERISTRPTPPRTAPARRDPAAVPVGGHGATVRRQFPPRAATAQLRFRPRAPGAVPLPRAAAARRRRHPRPPGTAPCRGAATDSAADRRRFRAVPPPRPKPTPTDAPARARPRTANLTMPLDCSASRVGRSLA
jgi:hypothetical protein